MFSNKGQIVQMVVAIGAFLLAVTVVPQRMSAKEAGIVFNILLVIVAVCIWAWIKGSDERALEAKAKRISLLKSLCDLPSVPQQHLLSKRLEEETRQIVDVLMGWRKRADWYGFCAGFGLVWALLLIPGLTKFLVDLTTLGARTPGGEATLGGIRYGTYYELAAVSTIVGMCWQLVYRPVRDRVAERVLNALRRNNGEFEPVRHVAESVRSYFRDYMLPKVGSRQTEE